MRRHLLRLLMKYELSFFFPKHWGSGVREREISALAAQKLLGVDWISTSFQFLTSCFQKKYVPCWIKLRGSQLGGFLNLSWWRLFLKYTEPVAAPKRREAVQRAAGTETFMTSKKPAWTRLVGISGFYHYFRFLKIVGVFLAVAVSCWQF